MAGRKIDVRCGFKVEASGGVIVSQDRWHGLLEHGHLGRPVCRNSASKRLQARCRYNGARLSKHVKTQFWPRNPLWPAGHAPRCITFFFPLVLVQKLSRQCWGRVGGRESNQLSSCSVPREIRVPAKSSGQHYSPSNFGKRWRSLSLSLSFAAGRSFMRNS